MDKNTLERAHRLMGDLNALKKITLPLQNGGYPIAIIVKGSDNSYEKVYLDSPVIVSVKDFIIEQCQRQTDEIEKELKAL